MPSLGRRPLLKGAGVALAGLGGLAGSAAAKRGGATRLTDRAADILIYASFDGSNFTPMFPGHDRADGGLFDFGRIKMLPNGDLQNKFVLFGDILMQTGHPAYFLRHSEGGLYRSEGQEMVFKARSKEQIEAALEAILPFPNVELETMFPPLARLAGGRWRAVGDEYAKLATDTDGNPDPALPEWGATRVDFFDVPSKDHAVSLVYVIGADDAGTPDVDAIPPAAYAHAQQLMAGGILSPRGT